MFSFSVVRQAHKPLTRQISNFISSKFGGFVKNLFENDCSHVSLRMKNWEIDHLEIVKQIFREQVFKIKQKIKYENGNKLPNLNCKALLVLPPDRSPFSVINVPMFDFFSGVFGEGQISQCFREMKEIDPDFSLNVFMEDITEV